MSNSSASNSSSADDTVNWASPVIPTSIPWVDCFINEGNAINVTWSCCNLTVPIDYRNASSNLTTTIGIVRGRPKEITTPQGALFTNPGGPSGGVIMGNVLANATDYFDVTQRKFDIMLMDPRGVGWSNHLTCGFNDYTYGLYDNATTAVMNSLTQMSPGPLSQGVLLQETQYYAASQGGLCGDTESKYYLAHMNTPNVCRDFDLIRNLTGWPTFDYWGYSYGTAIGAMYGQMFPDRVGHMVLDGVVDYTARQSKTGNVLDYSFASHSEIPRILKDFAAQCVAAAQLDTHYCPLAINSLNDSDPTSDVIDRMNAVLNNLMNASYVSPINGQVASFLNLGQSIRSGLMSTRRFPRLANIFLNIETLIRNQTGSNPTRSSNLVVRDIAPINSTVVNGSLITTVGWDSSNPITGDMNAFTFPAVTCLDVSYANIDTAESFTNYLYNQIQQQPLVAELGGPFAQCLDWPNLTDYGVETIYADNYPAQLANKMLVIGVTDDPVCPYPGALNTYELIAGSNGDNAVFLVHDGMGHCSTADPNNCTTAALTSYFVNGTVPVNGTTCVTDNTGADNIFVKYYQPQTVTSNSSSNEALRLGLGIGLGLGIPILIGCIALGWFLMHRRKKAKAAAGGSVAAAAAAATPADRERQGSGTESENKEAPSISSSAVEVRN